MPTKLTIVDTHRSWNESAAVYLRVHGHDDIATSEDPAEGLALAKDRLGIVIAGLRMGIHCGLTFAAKLRESDRDARIIISSSFWTQTAAVEAMQLGVNGSHDRERDGMDELRMAVRCVARGQCFASPALVTSTIPFLLAGGIKLSPLSEREERVLFGIYMRRPYKAIAEEASVAETTVGRDRATIAEKLRVPNTEFDVIEYAERIGLIDYIRRRRFSGA